MLWLSHQLKDYGYEIKETPIFCDDTSAINLTKNPVQHSRTKHIEIRHHFIREHVSSGDVVLNFVKSEFQLADIFTKRLSKDRFNFIWRELRLCNVLYNT